MQCVAENRQRRCMFSEHCSLFRVDEDQVDGFLGLSH